MLVAAALCPHPPLLVPGVGAGASEELDDLRAASVAAAESLRDVELVVVVGDAPRVGPFPASAWGSLRPYGVPLDVGSGPDRPSLPLSLTLGSWLLERAGLRSPSLLFGVSDDSPAARCASLGEGVAGRAERVGLLVMGDGSARRSLKGPGYLDDRAEPFDAAIVQALRDGDPEGLLAADEQLARELLVAGRASWQVLAGAAAGGSWAGTVTYSAAPYGVAYLVATWS